MTKFKELKKVVAQLRAQDGCDWDREQTLDSLQPYLLEETYEVLNAIEMRDNQNLKGELGDLLFVILLMTQIASETDTFDIEDVIHEITKKMVRRHPDVFPSKDTAEMISKSWEQRKTRERSRNTSVLDGIPAALPSLLSAYRITEKASGIGFDWPEYAPVREKLNEELQEFDDAYATQDAAAIDHEFGDLLFTLVNMSRFLPVTPESSLRRAVRRFETRFKHVEQAVAASGRDMHNVPMTELERFWSRAKEAECS